MSAPTYPAGACVTCIHDYTACHHRKEDEARERANRESLKRVLAAAHEQELAGLCLRHELESDEGGSRMEKAERIWQQTANNC